MSQTTSNSEPSRSIRRQGRSPAAAVRRWHLAALLFSALGALVTAPSGAQDTHATIEERVAAFFEAYNRFDGSHIAYYHQEMVLEDVTVNTSIRSRAALEELYQQSLASYQAVHFQIEEQLMGAGPHHDRIAVRGRLRGEALGREFDVPFATWLRFQDGLITRQVDFVDYAALRQQVQPEEGPAEDHP